MILRNDVLTFVYSPGVGIEASKHACNQGFVELCLIIVERKIVRYCEIGILQLSRHFVTSQKAENSCEIHDTGQGKVVDKREIKHGTYHDNHKGKENYHL